MIRDLVAVPLTSPERRQRVTIVDCRVTKLLAYSIEVQRIFKRHHPFSTCLVSHYSVDVESRAAFEKWPSHLMFKRSTPSWLISLCRSEVLAQIELRDLHLLVLFMPDVGQFRNIRVQPATLSDCLTTTGDTVLGRLMDVSDVCINALSIGARGAKGIERRWTKVPQAFAPSVNYCEGLEKSNGYWTREGHTAFVVGIARMSCNKKVEDLARHGRSMHPLVVIASESIPTMHLPLTKTIHNNRH